MMSRKFPANIQMKFRESTTKAAFVTDGQSDNPADCKNCGGLGVVYAFIAIGGPFNDVPRPPIIAHFADGKWWAGENEAGECPVCEGSGADPDYIAPPVRERDMSMSFLKGKKK